MTLFVVDTSSQLKVLKNSCFEQVEAFPITVMFGMCSIFLFVASLLQRRLLGIAESQRPSEFLLDCFFICLLLFTKVDSFLDILVLNVIFKSELKF